MTRLGLTAALVTALLAAPVAQSRTDAPAPVLDVTFSATGAVTVTLPDGTPVGTTAGSPTVIPAGAYAISASGPGSCVILPIFDLRGPGVAVQTDMNGGENDAATYTASFAPSATYTWRLDNVSPPVVHTFVTSGTVLTGSATSGGPVTTSGGGLSSSDIVGSELPPFRGRLQATLGVKGALTVSFAGKRPAKLRPGRYTLVVRDSSGTLGLTLRHGTHAPVLTSTASFRGTHTEAIALTAGRWTLAAGTAHASFTVTG